MRSLLVAGLAVTLSLALPERPADAARQRPQPTSRNRTRAQGGPSALGVVGTGSGEMVRAQQQRAQRGAAARQRRMSPREQLLAARDRQLARDSGVGFTSREEAAAYTRVRARLVQIRTFAVAVATGIAGGFFAKAMTAMGAFHEGFRHIASDPNFGNPIAQMLDHNFAIGAVIGAGASLVIGSVRAAQLRRRADAIERGEVDLASVD